MKFVYLTAKKYPGSTADHNYIFNLAKAFYKKLGQDFIFTACNTSDTIIPELNLEDIRVPKFIKRTVFIFFWFPWFWFKKLSREYTNTGEKIILFSNDQNLLVVACFWRWVLDLPIIIVADWHLLTETWKDRFVAKNTDLSITTCDKLKKAVLNLNLFSRVTTVYGGVDPDIFSIDYEKDDIRHKLNLPVDKFLVGYVGLFKTMGQEKGIRTMIDALAYLDNNTHMIFVGGKQDEINYYSSYAKDKNLLSKCSFLPIQAFDKVVLYEKAMDILVIPYPDQPHFREYGFPMKVYEYMASNVPIVYTKLDLLEEIISDCAFGIDPDSPTGLGNMISYIKSHYNEARLRTQKAYEKVNKLSWNNKVQDIIIASGIIPNMLTIPNHTLKYILFQRTEFSIYQSYPKLLRVVMNKKFPIYNLAINLEALIFPNRTKKFFSIDMEREIGSLKKYLPNNPKKILDIGCGVAGIDIMLNRHYDNNPVFYLLDKSEVNSKVYYGLEKKAAYYNSLKLAKELLVLNGISADKIYTEEVGEKPIFFDQKFDLVLSLISWGFHYPVSTYLNQVYNLLNSGGTLIIDVRKDSGGEEELRNKFGNLEVIYDARKHRRVLIKKK